MNNPPFKGDLSNAELNFKMISCTIQRITENQLGICETSKPNFLRIWLRSYGALRHRENMLQRKTCDKASLQVPMIDIAPPCDQGGAKNSSICFLNHNQNLNGMRFAAETPRLEAVTPGSMRSARSVPIHTWHNFAHRIQHT